MPENDGDLRWCVGLAIVPHLQFDPFSNDAGGERRIRLSTCSGLLKR